MLICLKQNMDLDWQDCITLPTCTMPATRTRNTALGWHHAHTRYINFIRRIVCHLDGSVVKDSYVKRESRVRCPVLVYSFLL